MTYLDIRSNNFNSYAVEEFSRYLRTTEVLQYLNISACQLWGRVAEKVIDALMLNTTLQYLDISHNRFTSKNYIIAAKVGRLVQGHTQLLHVDMSNCQLIREELFYLTMCLRDSKNIQGFHLTGNTCSHYDRLLMRALLPCKVRWPSRQQYQPRFEKVSGSDKITLIMLNISFLTTLPPSFIPEIGLSNVQTVQEVREKIRSNELLRQIEDKIENNSEKEYKKTEVHYKTIVESCLDNLRIKNNKAGNRPLSPTSYLSSPNANSAQSAAELQG